MGITVFPNRVIFLPSRTFYFSISLANHLAFLTALFDTPDPLAFCTSEGGVAMGQLSIINSRCHVPPHPVAYFLMCADPVMKWVDTGGGLETLLWMLFYTGGCSSRHMGQRRAGL